MEESRSEATSESAGSASPPQVDPAAYLSDADAELGRCAAEHWWAEGPDLGAGPMPIVLGWEAVRETLTDRSLSPRSFAAAMAAAGLHADTAFQIAPLFSMHGDEHRQMRAVMTAAFTPRQVEQMRPVAAQTCEGLAEGISAAGGRCEFVAAFAEPLPPRVFATLFGLPVEDSGRLARWATDIGQAFSMSFTPDQVTVVEAAAAEMRDYAHGRIEECRLDPGDDLVSRMLAAEVEGRAMTDDEIVAMVTGFVFAGAETTRRQLTAAMQTFAEHPAAWRRLGDEPALVPGAVEELLRHSGIIPGLTRRAEEPFERSDLRVEPGGDVLLTFFPANNDPAQYTEPRHFDVERGNAATHVTFGWGPHFCVGAGLARMELTEALKALTGRFGPPIVERAGPSTVLSAPDELWVRFED